jgi:hypothetical protein
MRAKDPLRGFVDLMAEAPPESPKLRRKDPLRASQLAVEQRVSRDSREFIARELERLAERLMAEPVPAPASAPVPPHVPRPAPPGAPPPPKLAYDARLGWHIPSTLSREQLAKMHAWARSDRSR